MAMTDPSASMLPEQEFAYWSAGIAVDPLREHRWPSDRRLLEIVASRAVSLRGWNYPHIPKNEPPEGVVLLPDGGIEATTAWSQYREVWRFHPSGLFTHRWRMREDGTRYRGTIHITAAIYTITEIFEFGRRLYRDDETATQVMFRIQMEGVLGRFSSGDGPFGEPYSERAVRNAAMHTATLPRVDLVAGVVDVSVDAAESVFGQLGYTEIPRTFIEHTTQQFLSGKV
jgi:hypothetical protein